eukprot:9961271-Lingulodinium_polyedra.AAC.1
MRRAQIGNVAVQVGGDEEPAGVVLHNDRIACAEAAEVVALLGDPNLAAVGAMLRGAGDEGDIGVHDADGGAVGARLLEHDD